MYRFEFLRYMVFAIVFVLATCAPPGGDPCGGSQVTGAMSNSQLLHGSYGGYLSWPDLKSTENEKLCVALFQSDSSMSSSDYSRVIPAMTAYHCVRDLVISYMKHKKQHGDAKEFPIYISLDVQSGDGNLCRSREKNNITLTHIRIPFRLQDSQFLSDLLKKYQHIYDQLPASKQDQFDVYIQQHERRWLEHFAHKGVKDEKESDLFDRSICSTAQNGSVHTKFIENKFQNSNQNLDIACYLYSDTTRIDIRLSHSLRYTSQQRQCIRSASIFDKHTWTFMDKEFSVVIENLQKESLAFRNFQEEDRSIPDSLELALDRVRDKFFPSEENAENSFYHSYTTDLKDKDNVTLKRDVGLKTYSAFSPVHQNVYKFSELSLSPMNNGENLKIPQKSVGSHLYGVVFRKNWGIALFFDSRTININPQSSGSIMAYQGHVLGILHSVNGREYSGSTPAIGSTNHSVAYVDVQNPDDTSGQKEDNTSIVAASGSDGSRDRVYPPINRTGKAPSSSPPQNHQKHTSPVAGASSPSSPSSSLQQTSARDDMTNLSQRNTQNTHSATSSSSAAPCIPQGGAAGGNS